MKYIFLDSKVHGANMGLMWDRQDPGGPHVGPMNFDIWVVSINEFLHQNESLRENSVM